MYVVKQYFRIDHARAPNFLVTITKLSGCGKPHFARLARFLGTVCRVSRRSSVTTKTQPEDFIYWFNGGEGMADTT